MEYNQIFMDKAISLAQKAYQLDEVPVGAIIVKDGVVVASAYNKREVCQDATAHAEILAIKKACKKVKDFRLIGCDMYVSLEPCVMCVGAILNARIDNVFYGASITNGSISCKQLCELSNLNHKTNFEGGFSKEICAKLVSDYFKEKRK